MKNEARAVANVSMEKLAIVVNALAIDDPPILYATNMPLVKERGTTPTPELQKPQGVVATNCQNSGDVKVTVKEAIGAEFFVYQYTLDPVSEKSIWESEGSRRKSFVFEGLTQGTKVWFRVIAVGSYHQQMISDAVSCIIL